MNDYNEDMIIAKRNILALNEGIKSCERKRQENSIKLDQLSVAVSQLTAQLQTVITQIALLRAQSVGRGPTVYGDKY